MRSANIRKFIRTPLFAAGASIQCLSTALIGVVLLAIRLGWIDIVRIRLETPLDEPSPKLDALYWFFRFLIIAFASGFAFYAVALYKLRNVQPADAPNERPAMPVER